MIEARDVSFSYDRREVLRALSFRLAQPAFVGIKGDNGSGKTTFLRLLSGLEKPASGDIVVSSEEKIAFVRQTATGEEMGVPATVEEIVSLGQLRKGSLFLPKSEKKRREEILASTGLSAIRKKIFSSLSGGQKQRVKLARALLEEPTILLLDEPTTGLDAESKKAFLSLIQKKRERGLTVVMVSHDPLDFTSADEIYRLAEGKLLRESDHVQL